MPRKERVLQLIEQAEGAAPQEQIRRFKREKSGDVSASTAGDEIVGDKAACEGG